MEWFLWASLVHIVLPLGQAGITEIPNEAGLLANLHATLGEAPGLYLFPGMSGGCDMSQHEAKLAVNPSGMIYHPPGAHGMTPPQLITEFLTELVEAVILAWLMAQSRMASMSSRIGLALAV